MGVLQITMQGKDTYLPGTFNLDDEVGIDSPTLELGANFTVKRIRRDFSDPEFVEMDLGKRRVEDWQFDKRIARALSDLAAIQG